MSKRALEQLKIVLKDYPKGAFLVAISSWIILGAFAAGASFLGG